MNLLALNVITPQLIIAGGIVLAMLLVAWQRSQQLIANFTVLILIIALIATLNGFGIEKLSVTQLLAVDDYSRYAFILVLFASRVCFYLSKRMLKQVEDVHDEYYLLLLLVVLGAGILVIASCISGSNSWSIDLKCFKPLFSKVVLNLLKTRSTPFRIVFTSPFLSMFCNARSKSSITGIKSVIISCPAVLKSSIRSFDVRLR